MINKTRLLKLEQHRPKWAYPSFTDMYSTQTTDSYMAWMLTNNPRATRQDILDLNIKALADMYEH